MFYKLTTFYSNNPVMMNLKKKNKDLKWTEDDTGDMTESNNEKNGEPSMMAIDDIETDSERTGTLSSPSQKIWISSQDADTAVGKGLDKEGQEQAEAKINSKGYYAGVGELLLV